MTSLAEAACAAFNECVDGLAGRQAERNAGLDAALKGINLAGVTFDGGDLKAGQQQGPSSTQNLVAGLENGGRSA